MSKVVNTINDRIDIITRLVGMHRDGLLGGEVMPEDALIGIVPVEKTT